MSIENRLAFRCCFWRVESVRKVVDNLLGELERTLSLWLINVDTGNLTEMGISL